MNQQEHAQELLEAIQRQFSTIDVESMTLALNNLLGEIEGDSDGSVSDESHGKLQMFAEAIGQLSDVLPEIQAY